MLRTTANGAKRICVPSLLRVAQQVRNYRRAIALEAMPPNERRIVHMALADSKDIGTESIGEGEERRVVISLKAHWKIACQTCTGWCG